MRGLPDRGIRAVSRRRIGRGIAPATPAALRRRAHAGRGTAGGAVFAAFACVHRPAFG